jgi:hypothetical protein
MKRNTSAGGKSTPRRKSSTGERRERGRDEDAVDLDATEYAGVDWDRLPRRSVELDPILIERMRARRQLRQLTLRVGEEQIAEARRVAARTGAKYQAVLRQWLAEGASRARAERIKKTKGAA